MGFTLGFSAGVMLLVSFVELLPSGIETIGFLRAHIAFFLGMLLFFLIDECLPHEYLGRQEYGKDKNMMRTGMLVALGIGVHNFPEGLATFVGALEDVHLGVAIAVAVAIHNIPEGLAVAAPIYRATGSRRKAFWWSFFSGVSEPIGAGLAALILMPFLSASLLGWVLAAVAGIMVAISIHELIPVSRSFNAGHMPIVGVTLGMIVMASSLWILS